MKFRPLHDRVLVRRIEQDEKTAGGIIIPDTAQEKPTEGEVQAVGSGVRDENGKLQPLDVKAGDRILFGKWSGTEVELDGEELLIQLGFLPEGRALATRSGSHRTAIAEQCTPLARRAARRSAAIGPMPRYIVPPAVGQQPACWNLPATRLRQCEGSRRGKQRVWRGNPGYWRNVPPPDGGG